MRRFRQACSLCIALSAIAFIMPRGVEARSTPNLPQLSADWWRWAFSIPAEENPLLDETGEHCAEGQSRSIWFLAGVLNVSGTATRTCAIPSGNKIVFPVFNVEADNFFGFIPDLTCSTADLRHQAQLLVDAADRLTATIDGVDVPFQRVQSPIFSVTLPENNVLQAIGVTDALPGTYDNIVSDGYWAILSPPSVGQHEIHFSAHFPGITIEPEDAPTCGLTDNLVFGEFSLDITYHITVTPDGTVSSSP